MDLELTGTVAVVTGASRGIGRAVATGLAAEGASLVLAAREAARLDQAVAELSAEFGVGALAVPGDLSEPSAPARVIEAGLERFGRIDTLVNVAGSTMQGRIGELSDEDWATAFGLKFMGAVRGIRAVLPHMRERGSGCVVNIGGVAGWQPGPTQLAIGAVNAALFNLTRGLAREAAAEGVRVNTVVPGMTDTDRFRKRLNARVEAEGRPEAEVFAAMVSEVPDGRPGRPEEVAAAVAFLASPRAAHINGVVLEIDGGQTRGMH